jgi:ribosome-associated protein
VSAISEWIGHNLAKSGEHPSHVEGEAESRWVLMDYGDVVVHIFDEQTRTYYGLEKLWSDAPRIPVVARSHELQGTSP